MTDRIDVLDHGYVRLVDSMGSDLSVVRAARVSYDADWRSGEDDGKDAKLIDYMMRNGHTSPFESVTFTFEVAAPIFVFRQWHRHRTWAFNEISARYSELPEVYYAPALNQITTQSEDNKQQRTTELHPMGQIFQRDIQDGCDNAFSIYKQMLSEGCPRELARCVLPLGTYSRMFGTVNLHNLFRFVALRDHDHAQHEILVYAQAMLLLITPIVPVSVMAFQKHRGIP